MSKTLPYLFICDSNLNKLHVVKINKPIDLTSVINDVIYFDAIDHKMSFKHGSRFFRNISHVFKTMCSFTPQPFIYLITTKSFIAIGNKKISKRFFRYRSNVFFLHHVAKVKQLVDLVICV